MNRPSSFRVLRHAGRPTVTSGVQEIREPGDRRERQDFPRDQADALARELGSAISGEVRFEDGYRALYAVDGSNYRQTPIGVVIPLTIDDVVQTVALARKYGAPVLPRGGGTSLAGQSCNVAVIIDFSKYLNQIIELNPREKYAWVQPGVVLDHLRKIGRAHV